MQTLETTDPNEVRRCRIAQFSGRSTKLKVADTSITGIVRSIREGNSGAQRTWIITVIEREIGRSSTQQETQI
jgi:hypothetical protein